MPHGIYRFSLIRGEKGAQDAAPGALQALHPDVTVSFPGAPGEGATMTVFFVVSGLGQALAGFLVDRFGAARVFGGFMDGRRFGEVLVGIAILQSLAILAALRVGRTV